MGSNRRIVDLPRGEKVRYSLLFEKKIELDNFVYYDYRIKEAGKKSMEPGVIVIDKKTLERVRVEIAEGDSAYSRSVTTWEKFKDNILNTDTTVMGNHTEVCHADSVFNQIMENYRLTGKFISNGSIEETIEKCPI